MSVDGVTGGSLWVETGPVAREFPVLEGHVDAEVAVIGGGIVGVTTALLLAESGVDVALIEADRIGCGVTGHTTAKVSSQHGLIYARLRSKHGAAGAHLYGRANEEALEWIAARVRERDIDCDFRRRSSYAYLSPGSDLGDLQQEQEAAREAGLPATLADELPLPYPIAGAVRFDNQAEFHVRKYLLALTAQLAEAGGAIFERSRAVEADMDTPCLVKTAGGRVRADQVVVATHYPFLDRALAFARVHPHRSYAIACRIAGEPPPGMFISGDSPTRSIRSAPADGDELLLVGGEGHRTGQGGDTRERYRALEQFARAHWDVESVEYRWSAQDNTTLDNVPYVGRLTPLSRRAFMATGFAKWGLSGGTASALLLSDLIQGRDNAFAGFFDPCRLKPLAAGPKLIEENALVALRFLGDRLTKPGLRNVEELAPGEGDIVRHHGQRVAAYRSDHGELVAVSTRCTHLGCQVNWNDAERSWDCPCHGSRFSPEGEVLQGPAVRRLERRPLG